MELLLDWSSAAANDAARVARDLISARTLIPPGIWDDADPEIGLFLQVLEDVSERAQSDPAFLRFLIGSLAGHAFLFGRACGHPAINDLEAALDLARVSNDYCGWVL